MKIIDFEIPNLEKLDCAIVHIDCALSMLKGIKLKELDATNGMTISCAIDALQNRKAFLKDALDDLKMLEGREPWQKLDT